MTGHITFEFLAWGASVLSAVLLAAFAYWRWLEARFRHLDDKIAMVWRAVDQLRLEMTRDYASVNHIEKVEQRLVLALDRLADEVTKLRETWSHPPARRKPPAD